MPGNFPIYIPASGDAQNSEVLRQFRLLDRAIFASSATTATGTISNAVTIVNSSSATTQTLPSAVGYVGIITVKNRGNGVVTISPLGSETIDGKTAAHLYRNGCVSMISDGSNWIVLSILSASYT